MKIFIAKSEEKLAKETLDYWTDVTKSYIERYAYGHVRREDMMASLDSLDRLRGKYDDAIAKARAERGTV